LVALTAALLVDLALGLKLHQTTKVPLILVDQVEHQHQHLVQLQHQHQHLVQQRQHLHLVVLVLQVVVVLVCFSLEVPLPHLHSQLGLILLPQQLEDLGQHEPQEDTDKENRKIKKSVCQEFYIHIYFL